MSSPTDLLSMVGAIRPVTDRPTITGTVLPSLFCPSNNRRLVIASTSVSTPLGLVSGVLTVPERDATIRLLVVEPTDGASAVARAGTDTRERP